MIIKLPFSNTGIKLSRISLPNSSTNSGILKRDQKVFVIGFGKTGTSSLKKTFDILGINVGNQSNAEMLIKEVYGGDFERLIRYCSTAQAFQDIPFMLPGVFKALDEHFVDSKFILTVRDSSEQWFDSKCKSHTNLFSSDKSRPPNEEDCLNAMYRYKGYLMDTAKYIWNYPEVPLYDKRGYIAIYEKYNLEAEQYFKDRPKDFLKINLACNEDFRRFTDFLGINTRMNSFPWENKTK